MNYRSWADMLFCAFLNFLSKHLELPSICSDLPSFNIKLGNKWTFKSEKGVRLQCGDMGKKSSGREQRISAPLIIGAGEWEPKARCREARGTASAPHRLQPADFKRPKPSVFLKWQ